MSAMDALKRATDWIRDHPGIVLTLLVAALVVWQAWDSVKDHPTFVLAIAAIGLTVWQAGIARNHNRLSVRPKLTLYAATNLAHGSIVIGTVLIDARNAGLGSAIVTSYRVWFDGQALDTDDDAAVDNALAQLFGHRHFDRENSFVLHGEHVMRAGDKEILLSVRFALIAGGPDIAAALRAVRDRFTVEIMYRSMYNEDLVCTWPHERGIA